mgnify:CR=1 FL=1
MKNKYIIILFGAPGSGKTTIGEKLSEVLQKSIFISAGSVMREEMKLTPPFLDVDRGRVVDFIFKKYRDSGSDTLILDCNPYPPEMWGECKKKINLFDKSFFAEINAPDEILLRRLNKRKRIDHKDFSYEQRLKYYYNNVRPRINILAKHEEVMSFKNINLDDVDKIIMKIKELVACGNNKTLYKI